MKIEQEFLAALAAVSAARAAARAASENEALAKAARETSPCHRKAFSPTCKVCVRQQRTAARAAAAAASATAAGRIYDAVCERRSSQLERRTQ